MAETVRPDLPALAGEQTLTPSDGTLQGTLDAIVLERLRPISAGIAALFAAFAVYNLLDPWLPLSAAQLGLLTATNVAIIGLSSLLFLALRAGTFSAARAHPLLGFTCAVLLAHTVFSLWQTQDLFFTHYLVVLLVGVGAIALSPRWHAAIVIATYALFCLVAIPIGGVEDWVRFSFVLLASGMVSVALMICRVANHRRLYEEVARRRVIEERLSDANQRLEDLSQRDPLTNLFNRRGIFDRLEVELARAERGHTLALLLIDLDGFKEVNDRYGHVEGDRLLQAIAEALRRSTRTSDAACRYGGDEFLVILSDTREEDASATAARLVDRVRKVGLQLFPASPVTASGGLAIARAGDTPVALVERADLGVYEAKRGGGDHVRPAA